MLMATLCVLFTVTTSGAQARRYYARAYQCAPLYAARRVYGYGGGCYMNAYANQLYWQQLQYQQMLAQLRYQQMMQEMQYQQMLQCQGMSF